MLLEIGFTLLLVFSISTCYIIRNLLIQNSTYERWIINLANRVESTWNKMKELDARDQYEGTRTETQGDGPGPLESDDEVGVVFEEIKKLLEELNEKLGEEDATEEGSEEDEEIKASYESRLSH